MSLSAEHNTFVAQWFSLLSQNTPLTEMSRLGIEEEINFLALDLKDFLENYRFIYNEQASRNSPGPYGLYRAHPAQSPVLLNHSAQGLAEHLFKEFKNTRPSFSLMGQSINADAEELHIFEGLLVLGLINTSLTQKLQPLPHVSLFEPITHDMLASLLDVTDLALDNKIPALLGGITVPLYAELPLRERVLIVGSGSDMVFMAPGVSRVNKEFTQFIRSHMLDMQEPDLYLTTKEKPYQQLNDDTWRRKSKRQKFSKNG